MLTFARAFISLERPLMLLVLIAVILLMSFKMAPSSFVIDSIELILTFFRSLLQKSTKALPKDLRFFENVFISDFPRIFSAQPPDFGTDLASSVTNVPASVAVLTALESILPFTTSEKSTKP